MSDANDLMNEFADSVRRFRDIMDREGYGDPDEFVEKLKTALSELYFIGSKLRSVEPNTDEIFNIPNVQSDALKIPKKIADTFGKWTHYRLMFDPWDDNDSSFVMGDLADDLHDIYSDLVEPLVALEDGTGGHRDIQWSWHHTMVDHAGAHILGALNALHWARSRVVFSSDRSHGSGGDG